MAFVIVLATLLAAPAAMAATGVANCGHSATVVATNIDGCLGCQKDLYIGLRLLKHFVVCCAEAHRSPDKL
jgi:hypothetical protein